MNIARYKIRGTEMEYEFPTDGRRKRHDQIRALEAEILQRPQCQIRTEHAICGGIYTRTVYIPAGLEVTGLPHRHDHINIMFGDITVTIDDGVQRLTGHHVIPAAAGHMRAGYTHGDTVWTTVFATTLTDVEAIEDEMTDESERLQTRKFALSESKHKALEE